MGLAVELYFKAPRREAVSALTVSKFKDEGCICFNFPNTLKLYEFLVCVVVSKANTLRDFFGPRVGLTRSDGLVSLP